MSRTRPVVAIDGPAGSGKTTVARLVAESLGYSLVDTGALYRCVALQALQAGVDPQDGAALGRLAARIQVRFEDSSQGQRIFLDGREVTEEIRRPSVSAWASQVSVHPEVRQALLQVQRELGRAGGAVLEGRDIGTVVFADAEVKVFLTAATDVRARRRFAELEAKEPRVSLEETRKELTIRDRRDTTRSHAPLKPAADAVILATDDLSAQEVAALVVERVRLFLRGLGEGA